METPTSPFEPMAPMPAPHVSPPLPPVIPVQQKKGINPLVGALAVLIILAGAYVAYAKYTGVWPFAPTVQPILSTSPSPSVTTDPTAGWKTYTNTQYDISFKYPASWQLQTSAGNEYTAGYVQLFNYSTAGNEESPFFTPGTTKMEFSFSFDTRPDTTLTRTQFGSNEAYKKETTSTLGGYTLTSLRTFLQMPNNKFLQVLFYGDYGGNRLVSDKILSTFKFTTTDPTAGWKTYANTEYGFEFRYPAEWTITNGLNSEFGNDYYYVQLFSNNLSGEAAAISISIAQDKYNSNIRTYLTNPQVQQLIQETTVGGKSAYAVQGITPPTAHDFRVVFTNGKVYSISSHAPAFTDLADKAEIEPVFYQILSTFKFTK